MKSQLCLCLYQCLYVSRHGGYSVTQHLMITLAAQPHCNTCHPSSQMHCYSDGSGLYILGGVTYPYAASTARYKSIYETEDVEFHIRIA